MTADRPSLFARRERAYEDLAAHLQEDAAGTALLGELDQSWRECNAQLAQDFAARLYALERGRKTRVEGSEGQLELWEVGT